MSIEQIVRRDVGGHWSAKTLTKDMADLPLFWSFRRCPYAIRARLALLSAGQPVALREIRLRDKPQAFLDASPSATVPNLELAEGTVDESLDIMRWALGQNDPDHLLDMSEVGWELIAQSDGPFKRALDHTKYAVRYPDVDSAVEREKASGFLYELNTRLTRHHYLMGDACSIADLAIFPFVRQFAFIDRGWFDAQPWPELIRWLEEFLQSSLFEQAMVKVPVWEEGADEVIFEAC